MLLCNKKYHTWFVIGFAAINIILILIFQWIVQDVKSGHSQILVFDVGCIATIILGAYALLTLLMLLYNILGKNLEINKNNLFLYGVKSAWILAIVFYDGVTLLDAPHTFFQDLSNTGSEYSFLTGIVLSILPLIFEVILTRKPFELKIKYMTIK